MKKTILLVILLVLGVVLSGCDVTYDIQKDDSIIITIECDEDDVDDFGESFDFDEGDLDTEEDLEDILDDIIDEYDDLEGEITVKSFKRTKGGDFTLKFEFIPNDDIEDAANDGIAVGIASDVLDFFADEMYDDDFEDIYDKEFSDDVDDEYYYVYDKNGDELSDKETEDYFDGAKLTKLKAALIEGEDIDVYVPGKIEVIISPDDSVDIDDDGSINFDDYVLIVYKTSSSPLLTLLIIALLAALGVGGYFAYDKFFAKKKDDEEIAIEVESEE